jgi:hypothetical protein
MSNGGPVGGSAFPQWPQYLVSQRFGLNPELVDGGHDLRRELPGQCRSLFYKFSKGAAAVGRASLFSRRLLTYSSDRGVFVGGRHRLGWFGHSAVMIILSRISKIIVTLNGVLARSRFFRALLRFADYATRLTVFFGIVSYLYEAPDRAKQRHYQGWQLIDAAYKQQGDGGRRDALQDLVRDSVLSYINLSNAQLQGIAIPGAMLQNATLHNTNLTGANLGCRRSVFAFLRFWSQDCSNPTNLADASLVTGDLSGATLAYSIIGNASFDGVNLTGTDFRYSSLDVAKFSNLGLLSTTFENSRIINRVLIKCC